MSLYSKISQENYEELKYHKEHGGNLVIVEYPLEDEITIECNSCYEVLISFFKSDPNE